MENWLDEERHDMNKFEQTLRLPIRATVVGAILTVWSYVATMYTKVRFASFNIIPVVKASARRSGLLA